MLLCFVYAVQLGGPPSWTVMRMRLCDYATICDYATASRFGHAQVAHRVRWRETAALGRLPGSPIAGSTCLVAEAVALCGTVFVLCSSCASGTSSALAGDSRGGAFAGQADCRQHLFGG